MFSKQLNFFPKKHKLLALESKRFNKFMIIVKLPEDAAMFVKQQRTSVVSATIDSDRHACLNFSYSLKSHKSSCYCPRRLLPLSNGFLSFSSSVSKICLTHKQ